MHTPQRSWHSVLVAGLAVLTAAGALAAPAPAAPTPQQRKAVLDAVRPMAAQRTGQAVRIRVERLNVDGGWALLSGELVAPGGGALAWQQVPGCHPELDKGLWATLQHSGGRWRVRQLQVCAPEPPLWGLAGQGGLRLPCGVYAGLLGPEGQDLQAACLVGQPARQTRP